MKSNSTLRERLEAAVMERHCANHPLTEKRAAGKLSRNAMMGWGIEQYHWISNIYRGELFKAANTPLSVQRLLLENYLEEADPTRPHLDIILRFVAANGADVERVKRDRGLPTTEAWVTFFNRVCKEEPFIASIAATNIGTESQSPALYSKVLPALRQFYQFLSIQRGRCKTFLVTCGSRYRTRWKRLRYPGPICHDPRAPGNGGPLRTRESADALVFFRWHLHPLRDGLQLALTTPCNAGRMVFKKGDVMDKPRIRHIAINVEDREKAAAYYKHVFKLEEKERGPNGTN